MKRVYRVIHAFGLWVYCLPTSNLVMFRNEEGKTPIYKYRFGCSAMAKLSPYLRRGGERIMAWANGKRQS